MVLYLLEMLQLGVSGEGDLSSFGVLGRVGLLACASGCSGFGALSQAQTKPPP